MNMEQRKRIKRFLSFINGFEESTLYQKYKETENYTDQDYEAAIALLQEIAEGKVGDDPITEDIFNVLEIEEIDQKLFTEHPDLLERAKRFEFDYSDFNHALLEHIESEAEKLGIDLAQYRR